MNLYLLRAYMDLHLMLFDIPPLCEAVLEYRRKRKVKRPKVKDDKDDYPAMVSRCCVKDFKYIPSKPFKSYYEKAKKPDPRFLWYKNNELITAMNNLGGIGKTSKFGTCTFPIGNCAEQRAAERLLRDNASCKLNHILFSTPIRPRTNEPKAYCENCKKLFTL